MQRKSVHAGRCRTGIPRRIDAMIPIGRGSGSLIIAIARPADRHRHRHPISNQKGRRTCLRLRCDRSEISLGGPTWWTCLREARRLDYHRGGGRQRARNLARFFNYLPPTPAAAIAEYLCTRAGPPWWSTDDLTKQAQAYRLSDVAACCSRPPGREAYPGTMFSTATARCSQRAAKLSDAYGARASMIRPCRSSNPGRRRVGLTSPTNV